MTSDVVQCRNLHAGYGEVRVLHGLNLKAGASGITAVVGSNGAGKSTLLRTIAGMLPPTSGEVLYDGMNLAGLPAEAVVDHGIVMVPEGRMVFPDMTVLENLTVGAITPRARHVRTETMEMVFDLFPRLRDRTRQLGGTLSGGEQQMLALGRGLMARPRVLLLDEPTLGLAPGIAKQIFRLVPKLVENGLSVIMAEQDVHATLKIAGFAYVLENGRIVAEGPGTSLLGDPVIRKAYLGAGG